MAYPNMSIPIKIIRNRSTIVRQRFLRQGPIIIHINPAATRIAPPNTRPIGIRAEVVFIYPPLKKL